MIERIKRLLRKKEPEYTTKIWGIVEGPILIEEIPDEELEGVPMTAQVMLVCRVEKDGQVGFEQYWYASLDDAYELVKYFSKNIEPLEVSLG
jgi:hypothetical protein